jgi:DNA recombination protein Rad52
MFTDEQYEMLEAKLDTSAVKQRDKSGFKLSYIEGWFAIKEANRIFGFDGWSRQTVYCKEVCRYEYNNKQKVGYEAKVLITIDGITREGTGHGSGIAKDLFDAIEGAAKEAETDAMKRALMTFGNPFGLALYDKDQADVGTVFFETKKARKDAYHKAYNEMNKCESVDDLKHLWGTELIKNLAHDARENPLFKDFFDQLNQKKDEHKLALARMEQEKEDSYDQGFGAS